MLSAQSSQDAARSKSTTEDRPSTMQQGIYNNKAVDPALCPTDHETIIQPNKLAPSAICPTDLDTIAPAQRKITDKHSADYILRSQLAGGVAGCAVRTDDFKCIIARLMFPRPRPLSPL